MKRRLTGLPSWMWRGDLALPLLVLAAAYTGVHALLISRFPLFVDESIDARFALTVQHDPSQFFVALTDKKGLLVSWLGALLVDANISALTAIRLISAASGLLLLVVVVLLGRELYNRTVGIVAGGLTLVMPLLLVQTAVGTYDSTVAALGAAALLLQIRLVRRPRVATAALLALAFAAGNLTKPSAYIAVVLLPASVLLFDWRTPSARRRFAQWTGCVGIALLGVVAAELLMRSSSLYFTKGPANYHPLSQVLAHPWVLVKAHWAPTTQALGGYVTAPVLLLGLFGALLGLMTDPRRMSVLLVWFGAPALAAIVIPYDAYARYLLPAVPALAVIAAYGITRSWSALAWSLRRARAAPVVTTLLVIAALVPSIVFDVGFVAHPRTTRYPALDEVGFVRGSGAAGVIVDAAAEIERRSAALPIVHVAHYGGYHDTLEFALNGRNDSAKRAFLIDESPSVDNARLAQFIVVEGDRVPPRISRFGFTLVGRYPRPHRGALVLLFQR